MFIRGRNNLSLPREEKSMLGVQLYKYSAIHLVPGFTTIRKCASEFMVLRRWTQMERVWNRN